MSSWSDKVQRMLGKMTSAVHFGEQLLHEPKVGAPQLFQGIWSDTYMEVDPSGALLVQSADPNVGVRLTDFIVQPRKGDKIVRFPGGAEVDYFIRSPEKDGEGGATLVLEKVKP